MGKKRTIWFKFTVILLVAFIAVFGCSCAKKAKKVEVKPTVQIPSPTPPAPLPPPAPKPPAEPVPAPVPPPPVPAPAPIEEKTVPPPPAPPVAVELKPCHFAFDRSDLRPDAIAVLNENLTVLKAHPEIKVVVEGHCDERGTVEYNIALGERRAKSVEEYYISGGVDKSRIRTISYGKERPIDPGHTEESWTKNRRGETVIEK